MRKPPFLVSYALMTWDEILGLALCLLVMGVGLVGTMLPGLPGTPLVFLAAFGHRLYFGEHGAADWVLWALGLLAGFSLLVDYFLTVLGARRFGASWKGILGAVIGGGVGILFGLPGVFLGPLIGALLFELAGGRKLRDSARAGLGAALGLVAGTIGRMACCLAMIGLFAISVLARSH